MELYKIKLQKLGLGGVELSYIKTSKKGIYNYNDEYKTKFKAPASLKLREMIQSLDDHLVLICRLNGSEASRESIRVTGVESDSATYFRIYAQVRTFDNTSFEIVTPKIIDGTEYKGFDNVMDVIRDVFEEAKLYVETEKMPSEEFILDMYSENINKDLSELSEDEKVEQAREVIEKFGGIVMMDEDYETSVSDVNEKDQGPEDDQSKNIQKGPDEEVNDIRENTASTEDDPTPGMNDSTIASEMAKKQRELQEQKEVSVPQSQPR